MRVLIIEDHDDIAANVGDFLAGRGWEVDFADTGPRGLALAREAGFDALILDLNLPGFDGLELLERLRADPSAASCHSPVLMLTARDTLDERLTGFSSGADDYLVKPFALQEVEARLLAITRRMGGKALRSDMLRSADLVMNMRTLEIRRGEKTLHLKPRARQLLELLFRADGAVLSRAQIEAAIWGDQPPDGEALRVHIHELRRTIDGPGDVPLLHTVRGAGYRLEVLPPC
ncbi:MAG: response regulator transcription factor [Oceanococcaceae bacterium]